MPTLDLRQKLIDIARRDVGKVEVTHNRAPWINKLWSATDIPNGHQLRYPYCSSGMAYCVREWLKDKDVLAQLKLTPFMAEAWRCKTAAAFAWNTWALNRKAAMQKEAKLREDPNYKPLPRSVQAQTFEANKQVFIINEQKDRNEGNPRQRLRVGDLMIFSMSHIGVVVNDAGSTIYSIEYNTGASGSREGEGCYEKTRDRKEARFFVRLMDP